MLNWCKHKAKYNNKLPTFWPFRPSLSVPGSPTGPSIPLRPGGPWNQNIRDLTSEHSDPLPWTQSLAMPEAVPTSGCAYKWTCPKLQSMWTGKYGFPVPKILTPCCGHCHWPCQRLCLGVDVSECHKSKVIKVDILYIIFVLFMTGVYLWLVFIYDWYLFMTGV